jgi:hypothetical protein
VLRKAQFHEIAMAKLINRGDDLRQMKLNHRPTGGRQNQNGKASGAQVLLRAKVLIGGDESIERRFGCIETVTIFERGSAHFVSGRKGVTQQGVAQRCGCSLVEENLHQFRRDLLAPSGRD